MIKKSILAALLIFSVTASAQSKILTSWPEEMMIGTRQQKEFRLPPVPEGKQVTISFRHRIDYPKAGGWCPCWQLEVNGMIIAPMANKKQSRLLNKPVVMNHKHHGKFHAANAGNLWYSLYLPAYDTADNFFKPATKESSRVEIDITDALHTDRENTVILRVRRIPENNYKKNKITTHKPALAVKDLQITLHDRQSPLTDKSAALADGEKLLLDGGREFFIERRDYKEFRFPAAPAGKQVVVEFRHRTDYPRPAGWCPCWQIEVNGKMLSSMATRTIPRLLNKPLKMYHKHHGWFKVDNGADMWYSLYLPDHHAADNLFKPATVEATRVVLDISDAVYTDKENVMRLRFGRVPPSYYTKDNITTHRPALVVRDLKVIAKKDASILTPKAEDKAVFIKMKKLPLPEFKCQNKGDALNISFNGKELPVRSRFTIPEGKFAAMNGNFLDTGYYTVKRRVEVKENRVDIFDTFTSKSKELIGLMVRYESAVGKFDPIWVAGDDAPSSITFAGGRNPSVFGKLNDSTGLGIIAVDDVLRVQNISRCENGFFGIGSDNLALSPGESRTLEWSIYPVRSGDYFDFINTVRKDWQVNFPITGGFTFGMNTFNTIDAKSAQISKINSALTMRSTGAHFWYHLGGKYANYIGTLNGIGYDSDRVRVRANGKVIDIDPEPMRKFDERCFARCKELTPDVKRFFYFHNQISQQSDDEKYADFRVIAANGKKVFYGSPTAKVFLPTHTNQLGKDVMKTLDYIINRFDIDGIYLDEANYCSHRIHYGDKMWDGCSVELDKNFKVKRKITFVTLAKLQFTLNFFDRIISHHKKLFIANFSPDTRSELRFKIPRFEETSSSRWIALSHLYTPIQLGDMLTFKNTPLDMAKDQRIALSRGALYYHYNGTTGCPSLTSKMYPFTPVELHSGYLIGEERILTIHSGEFGWFGTGKLAQLHVFDHLGREVKDYPAEVIKTPEGVMTRLDLKKDHSAALVKVPVSAEITGKAVLKNISYQNGSFRCQASGKGKVVFDFNGRKHAFPVDGNREISISK
ncbi:MAG: hypothetical protein IKC82_03745 [Lentisphaeria bacterium]|nr:hypothetical protein [Lentisphaeria bacterium]